MYNILVCDDEKDIVSALTIYLTTAGYQVFPAYDGTEALDLLRREDIHLVLLDIMMPKLDGIAALTRLREASNVPVILLTAKSEDTDKIQGLNLGADDYVTKPFNILALKARVRALLRRASMSAAQDPVKTSVLTRGHISVDTERRSAYKNGVAIELTMKEFDLIEFLMKNPGRVYSRENLLDLVWGYDYQGDTRTVDVHIRRLREKLELDPAHPEYIVTKWGVGYYFAD